jgi:outer membrane protein TolC
MQVTRAKWLGGILSPLAFLLGGSMFAQNSAVPPPELSLSDAIQIALDANPTVKIAKLDITKSQWQVAETKTKRFPQFKMDALASGDLNSPSFLFKAGTFGSVNGSPVPATDIHIALSHGITGFALATMGQPITQLYKIHLAIREQQLSTDLAGQKYEQSRQSLVADVKQAYYAILQTESGLDSERALVKQYQETERVAQQYLAQESVLKSDTLDVQAKLAQAEYQVSASEDTLQTQKEHLNDLLGRDLDTAFRTQEVPPITTEEMDLKVARETALRQRPEVKQAEINVSRANYDRKLAKADYIPDIDGDVRYVSPINTQILPENILSAGVRMSWQPFNWGGRRDEVKQKDVGVEQSRYQLNQVRSQVELDVDNTYRKLKESRILLNVAQAAREAANEHLREVNNQFKQSAVLLRDVLQQEAAVASADHEYEESLLSFWNAKAAFEKALGEE